MIKLFADTANSEEIKYCFERGVNDGITTNPKIMESTGDLSLGFEGACKRILSLYPGVPVSLETDFNGLEVSAVHGDPQEARSLLLKQAYELASWGKNVVVKIPICEGGLLAVRDLSSKGIKTNVTACMNPYQAIEAAKAGATYVSLFANRMLDCHILESAGHSLEEIAQGEGWKAVVKANNGAYGASAWSTTIRQIAYVANQLEGTNTELIVGSIRSPQDIIRLADAAPQIITIPTGIVKGLENIPALKASTRRSETELNFNNYGISLQHHMTDYTLTEFEKAALSYRK
ncbi:MAG: transaldolase family protein [Nanoarchaeota archaeon]|nr:transaldolase family protein [Nanoarchaeota archaeon]